MCARRANCHPSFVTRRSGLFVVPYPDEVARRACGFPGNVEPSVASEQLVSQIVAAQEIHQPLELLWVFRTDVGSLTLQVLGVAYATYLAVHGLVTIARVDDDGTNHLAGRFQQMAAAVCQVAYDLHCGDVARVPVQAEKFTEHEMRGKSDVVHGVTGFYVC